MTLMLQGAARPDRVSLEVLDQDGRRLSERVGVLKEPLRIDVPAT